jgi:hypothetical protein
MRDRPRIVLVSSRREATDPLVRTLCEEIRNGKTILSPDQQAAAIEHIAFQFEDFLNRALKQR